MPDFAGLRLRVARLAERWISRTDKLLPRLIGRWQWQAPPWIPRTGKYVSDSRRYLSSDPRRALAFTIGVALVGVALIWYLTRPTPDYVAYTVTDPPLTEYDERGIKTIHPVRVYFASSAAPLKYVGKEVTEGISVSPAIPGVWFWSDDKVLLFTPKDDWPVGTTFRVKMTRAFIAQGVAIKDYSFDFNSPPFSARITESIFYQDPIDPTLKKVVASVKFTHPVDTADFEKRVSIALAKDAAYLGLEPDSRFFTVVYDKFDLGAHIHSAALAMPRDDTPMTLKVDKGVRAKRGGNETPEALLTVVTVPGRSSLRLSGAHMTLVDNARYEPEQILLLTSSSPVSERALVGNVGAYVLPLRHPNQPAEQRRPYQWNDPVEIGKEILDKSDALPLTYVPSEEAGNTQHGFKFKAPIGRFVFVSVKDGIQGIGGYIAGKP